MKKWVPGIAALAFLVFIPLANWEGYYYRALTLMFLWVGLSSAWNITSGFSGYIDFGPVGYFGMGNYATALLMAKAGLPFFPSIGIGGAICGAMALLIGRYTMRLRGAYFGIATLAFAEAVRQIVLEFDATFNVSLFEGSHGVTLPIAHDLIFFYYTFLGGAATIVGASWLIHRSKFGYALRAIRESEIAAELSGVPTLRYKVSAYAVTGFFIGLLGGIHAYWLSYISPADVFNITHTIYMIIMALLGGMGTVSGPVLGAVLLSLANEVLAAEFLYTYFLLLGILLLAVIFFLPRGVGGLFFGNRMQR